jgi:hypothetical protein
MRNNSLNHKLRKDNVSGMNGVYWRTARCQWGCYIKVNNKPIWLGSFEDKFEAFCVRLSANKKYGFHEDHGREKV